MPSCANKGCGKFYEGEKEDCFYHPGGPVFHDALKGWSCCKKRVVEFDQFLKIDGCTKGFHSNVPIQTVMEPVQVEKPVKVEKPASVENKETFQLESLSVSPEKKQAPKIPENELFDAPDSVIQVGSKCKRPSCGKPFVDAHSKEETCVFHSGAPIFHEGSKGWTCCSRKVLEFDEFLKLKGCKQGKHRFTDGASTAGPVEINCRRDWYQTPDKIILSVFAKKVEKSNTTVKFENEKLLVDIEFQDGSIHKYHTELFQPIIPSESSFEILSTKLEIILKKANGISWAAIEPTNVSSWTTFGLQGGKGGTVGSKEAIIAGDAPLHMLKN